MGASFQRAGSSAGASALIAEVRATADPSTIARDERGKHLVSFVMSMTEDPDEISTAFITAKKISARLDAIIKALESARDI